MKKQISQFICFYLTVPLFVLATLIFGGIFLSKADAAYISEAPIRNEELSIFEKELFPSDMIDELLYLPDNMHPIISKTIRSEYNILNDTPYTVSESSLKDLTPSFTLNDSPLVLVVHTHGTECYFEEDEAMNVYYTSKGATVTAYYNEETVKTRTKDTEKNVVKVGEVFCEELKKRGVEAIHCKEMFDKDDYNNAYSLSGEAIKKYLEQYPDIKLVIDIHRDSLVSDDLVNIKTIAEETDIGCAQVMIVAGSDGGGAVYKNWERNLALDLIIKKVMDSKYPSLSRPIFLRGARYNQHLAYTSFLLEVGTCANTLEEALEAARRSAECIADAIKLCH